MFMRPNKPIGVLWFCRSCPYHFPAVLTYFPCLCPPLRPPPSVHVPISFPLRYPYAFAQEFLVLLVFPKIYLGCRLPQVVHALSCFKFPACSIGFPLGFLKAAYRIPPSSPKAFRQKRVKNCPQSLLKAPSPFQSFLILNGWVIQKESLIGPLLH